MVSGVGRCESREEVEIAGGGRLRDLGIAGQRSGSTDGVAYRKRRCCEQCRPRRSEEMSYLLMFGRESQPNVTLCTPVERLVSQL